MKISVPKKQGRLQQIFREKSNSILNFSEIYSTIQMLLFISMSWKTADHKEHQTSEEIRCRKGKKDESEKNRNRTFVRFIRKRNFTGTCGECM